MHTITRSRILAILIALPLVFAACGGSAADSATSQPAPSVTAGEATSTSSTAVATTTSQATTTTTAPATTTTVPETTTTSIATTTTATPATAAAAPPGSVVVTAEDGIYVVTSDGANQLMSYSVLPTFLSDLIDFAISDTRGGLIIQPNRSAFAFRGSASIVYRVPFGGSGIQEMLVPSEDQGLQLEDVVVQGGSVGVYYTRLEGSLPDDMLQTLRRYDLDAKTVTPIADVAGWESGTWNFSVGGDLIVNEWAGEAYYGFLFRELDGALTDWPLDPTAGGLFDCYPTCPIGISVSPGGHRLAYAQRDAGTFWVTIIDLESGTTVANFTLPDGVYEIHSIDLGDDYMVVNRIEEGSEWYITPLLVEIALGSPGVSEVPFNGLARLTDVIPQLNGVVAFP